jgi:NADPH-dependent methylglyoxal reductase
LTRYKISVRFTLGSVRNYSAVAEKNNLSKQTLTSDYITISYKMASKSSHTLLMTGASGFVGAHVLNAFLEQGYSVRAVARSERSISSIKDAHPAHASQLSFAIVPDLTAPDAFKDAMKGVSGVIHLASPFVLSPKDNEEELLKPAINATIEVLEDTAKYAPNVKRIVLIASFASILDLSKGLWPEKTYDESDWNPATYKEAAESTNGAFSYCASKKLAEEAAWKWIDEKKPSFALTTMCPPWVFGPHFEKIKSLDHLNESTEAIYKLITSKEDGELPPIDFAGFADARDLAKAHVLAYENEAAAGERFLVGNHFDYQAAADSIRKDFPNLRSRVPKGNPGHPEPTYKINGSKVEKVLGLKYTTLEQCMKDTVQNLLDAEASL